MKNIYHLLLLILLPLITSPLHAQQPDAPVFGTDIFINQQPSQNQTIVDVTSAFNGWLYAFIGYFEDFYPGASPSVAILKSTDNGVTWTKILDANLSVPGCVIKSADILAVGTSLSNLKLIVAYVTGYDSHITGLLSYAGVVNAETGAWEYTIAGGGGGNSFSLAWDYPFTAANSNPFSVGVLFSGSTPTCDSLVLLTSDNGAMSFDYECKIPATTLIAHQVKLSYGRSLSFPEGRYFAAWEEQNDLLEGPGKIFTAHTEGNAFGPFSDPVRLDGIDPACENLCQNPQISCINGGLDNDSSNITQLVAFEKFNPATGRSDIQLCMNMQATLSDYFHSVPVSNPMTNNQQPCLTYNVHDSAFGITWFDSTNKMLPLYSASSCIGPGGPWNVITEGYNDSANLSRPKPVVKAGINQGMWFNSWIADGSNGFGRAMFDSQYNTWTGISINEPSDKFSLHLYPNPCSRVLTIAYQSQQGCFVSFKICNTMGQVVDGLSGTRMNAGKQKIIRDVSNLPPGLYLLYFMINDIPFCKSFIISR